MDINVKALLWAYIVCFIFCLILAALSVFFSTKDRSDMVVACNGALIILVCAMLFASIFCLLFV